MNFLRKLFGSADESVEQDPTLVPTVTWNMLDVSTRDFLVSAVGESHYQKEIRRAQMERGSDFLYVYLKREPQNPYDANAVAVVSVLEETLGYLPRDLARQYAPVLDEVEESGFVARCQGRVDSVSKSRPMGIRLDADIADGVRKQLAAKMRSGEKALS